jgi:hypothetical protein
LFNLSGLEKVAINHAEKTPAKMDDRKEHEMSICVLKCVDNSHLANKREHLTGLRGLCIASVLNVVSRSA